MNRMSIFQALRSRRFSALVAVAGLGLLFTTPSAKAGGCSAIPFTAAAVRPIAYSIPARGAEPRNDDRDSRDHASIVGLWHLIYTATYTSNGSFLPVPSPAPPGGFQFLESYKTWHGDGTEFENAFLPPTGGNICFGVWKETGNGKVKLHHIGLMFNGNVIANVFTVDEIDTVARNGNTYTGSFDFKLFGGTDVYGTGTPLQEIKGTTAGTRITVD
jgi:hypothetical protein